MIHFVVNQQETVVCLCADVHINGGILCIVAFQVKSQFFVHSPCIYGGSDSALPFVEQSQYRFIHIIVYQDDGPLGRFNQVSGKDVGVEYLSVEEDSFHRRKCRVYEESYLFLCLAYPLFQPFHARIERIAFQQVFFQDFVGPLAELDAPAGIYPVAYGDDDIQVVIRAVAHDLPSSLVLNCSEFPNSCSLGQFLLFVDMLDVLADVGFAGLEKLYKLGLRQPHRFILYADFQFDGFVGLV